MAEKLINRTVKETVVAHPKARVVKITATFAPEAQGGEFVAKPYVRVRFSEGDYLGSDWVQTRELVDQVDDWSGDEVVAALVEKFRDDLVVLFAKRAKVKGIVKAALAT